MATSSGNRIHCVQGRVPAAYSRRLVAGIGLLIALLSFSCASHVRVLNTKVRHEQYVVQELRVTGRPIMTKRDSGLSLSIGGFTKPKAEHYEVSSSIPDATLQHRLDPQKTYRFVVYTTDQKMYDGRHIHNATLSKVEEGDREIIDASICDLHQRKMDFVPAHNVSWSLRSEKEKRDLEKFHNHGYAFPGCCSGGMVHWYTWRCPECAKKVDAFKSKYDP